MYIYIPIYIYTYIYYIYIYIYIYKTTGGLIYRSNIYKSLTKESGYF